MPAERLLIVGAGGRGLPLLPPEVPCNQFRQKILVIINAVEVDFAPWKDQQFIVGGCG